LGVGFIGIGWNWVVGIPNVANLVRFGTFFTIYFWGKRRLDFYYTQIDFDDGYGLSKELIKIFQIIL